MTKLCLDLCAGLGGFSRAFKERPDWKVITVDINPKFKTTMVLDLIDVVEHPENHEDFWSLKPDIILASPPCERWSIGNSQWPLPGIYDASRVLGAVLEIVARMKPTGWIIENPKGRMRWFLRKPRATVGLSQFGYKTVKPTDFWGNIDLGLLKYVDMSKNPHGFKFGRDVGRGSHQRAEMPHDLSRKVLEQFEESLHD